METVGREALYEEVWAEPMTAVARRYGLSDVGLAKICRKLAIPVPGRGYWAMVRAGRVMKKVPLPALKRGQSVTAVLTQLPPEVLAAKDRARRHAANARESLDGIVVPDELVAPHPLVAETHARLAKDRGWSDPKGLRSAPDEVLNINVTTGSMDRALRIADTLLKKLGDMEVVIHVDAARKGTYLEIAGTMIPFSIGEHVARSRHEITAAEKKARDRYYNRSRWDASVKFPSIPDYDYTPTGLLTISAGHWPSKNWRDTLRTSLEDRLAEVITGLFALAEETRAMEEESRRRREERRLAQERYQSQVQRREDERKRFEQLEDEASCFERALRLRAYASAAEQKALLDDGMIAPSLTEWLGWVRAKADWLDPLIAVSDPVLDAPEPKKPSYW